MMATEKKPVGDEPTQGVNILGGTKRPEEKGVNIVGGGKRPTEITVMDKHPEKKP